MDYIREEGGVLKIGALTRLEDIAKTEQRIIGCEDVILKEDPILLASWKLLMLCQNASIVTHLRPCYTPQAGNLSSLPNPEPGFGSAISDTWPYHPK